MPRGQDHSNASSKARSVSTCEAEQNDLRSRTKLQSRASESAFAEFGIKLHPGAGQVTNTAVGGFPVDRPDLQPLDQSVHANWKTRKGGFYSKWNERPPSRQTPGGFVKLAKKSFFDMPKKMIQNAIDTQREVHKECYKLRGGPTSFLN